MRAGAQSVDIKGDKLHSREPFGDEIRRAIVADKGADGENRCVAEKGSKPSFCGKKHAQTL
jgi:hypothetical protein